jgi:hypothetical protein
MHGINKHTWERLSSSGSHLDCLKNINQWKSCTHLVASSWRRVSILRDIDTDAQARLCYSTCGPSLLGTVHPLFFWLPRNGVQTRQCQDSMGPNNGGDECPDA